MPGERYRHIFLPDIAQTRRYTSPRRGGPAPRVPANRDRLRHSAFLRARLEEAWAGARPEQRAVVHAERYGLYLEFEGEPGFDLAFMSLESLRSGIRLLNVRTEGAAENARTYATVFVPQDQIGYFLRKIEKYANEETRGGRPKNVTLINSISDIRTAVLESFWRPEERELIPRETASWVEVWLRDENERTVQRFDALLATLEIVSAQGVLKFPERAVKLIQANRAHAEQLMMASDDIAEFRIAKEIASFFIRMDNQDQTLFAQELLNRTTYGGDRDVVVCILDTGVNNGHILIHPVLDDDDLLTVDPAWGTHDHDGHGTLMAGTAIYGDLADVLSTADQLVINHRLESAKILPPRGQNPIELWGHMSAQGISRAEIQAPHRKRIICVAVTCIDTRDRGRPSSWSAEIDKLASGAEDGAYRLIMISAGNVFGSENWLNYHAVNLTSEVEDPGQAWNGLTVGSYTEKVRLTDATMAGWKPIAPSGGLSPFSSTSRTWPARTWPIKPEVLLEGGNVAEGPHDSALDHDDLQLLSTCKDPHIAQFQAFGMTSASSALASRMAAQIQVQYPEAWPEAVRGLIVHSAEWTETMKTQFLPRQTASRQDYAELLRICGYGVPDFDRAIHCASNSLTLISQATLQPFDKLDSQYVTRDMHLYRLPWPSEILQGLGETEVTMRVTLSYFIEPGPGEIGWRDRYRYASHALRFAVNGPGENEDEFIRRVNVQARDDGEGHPGTVGPGDRWLIGDARNVGSIHSDIWQGHAAELAGSNIIAVYPAVGWWRERHHLNKWNKRCRYSLIVSVYTPENSENIYVPVAQRIGLAVPVEITLNVPTR